MASAMLVPSARSQLAASRPVPHGREAGGRSSGSADRAARWPARPRGLIVVEQVDNWCWLDRHASHQLGCGRTVHCGCEVLVGCGVFHQRWGRFYRGRHHLLDRCAAGSDPPSTSSQITLASSAGRSRRVRWRRREAFRPCADLGELARKQAGDLRLQRACVYDLAKRGVRCQRQQIAGHVEGACFQGAP